MNEKYWKISINKWLQNNSKKLLRNKIKSTKEQNIIQWIWEKLVFICIKSFKKKY